MYSAKLRERPSMRAAVAEKPVAGKVMAGPLPFSKMLMMASSASFPGGRGVQDHGLLSSASPVVPSKTLATFPISEGGRGPSRRGWRRTARTRGVQGETA
jgi:hypothetical protein